MEYRKIKVILDQSESIGEDSDTSIVAPNATVLQFEGLGTAVFNIQVKLAETLTYITLDTVDGADDANQLYVLPTLYNHVRVSRASGTGDPVVVAQFNY